jgi:alpha-glucosidase
MKRTFLAVLLAVFAASAARAEPDALKLKSPNGHLVVTFDVQKVDGGEGPCYRVDYKGRPVIARSGLGLELAAEAGEAAGPLGTMAIVKHTASKHWSVWEQRFGEWEWAFDRYNQVVLELKETQPPHRLMNVTFRAYDAGVAFCYSLPKQPGMKNARIAAENSEFRFAGDWPAWATYSGQGNYQKVPLSQIKPGCERPLVVEAADDLYVAVAEARLVDYARMKLKPLKGVPHALVSALDGGVESPLPLTTPWRVVMAADSPGRLLESNYLILNLNDPCAIADTSWIKPGKVIREVTLTTAGGKACVDFAVKRGLQYIEFDAGWYGHEYDKTSDARAVNLDPKRSKGPLDLAEVIRYADERGIGVILYVNHLALEKQIDELLPLYKKWGVKGIKFGFVNVGSQKWTAWLHEAIRKCAAHQLMVDVHDEYRPTGYSRTYPNLMTVEGIAGDETRPTNETTLTYVFTRMLAGPADNTACWTDPRVRKNATHAYQLAKPVCLFSPWQFLFWYDRPAAVADTPELEFYRRLPTTWDETRVLHGRIGQYAVIARRKGNEWFIGAMNGSEARRFDVPLKFLEPERRYTAHIYADDPTVTTPTGVKVERIPVTAATVYKLELSARGGQAIWIEPAGRNP